MFKKNKKQVAKSTAQKKTEKKEIIKGVAYSKATIEKKKKLAGEVYDLMVQRHNPEQIKNLPSRECYIYENIHGIGCIKPTKMQDLENYKKELQAELGISLKSQTKTTAVKNSVRKNTVAKRSPVKKPKKKLK